MSCGWEAALKEMQIEGTNAANKGCGEHNAGSDIDQTEKNVFDAGHAFEQILPFCVVIIWSKHDDASCTIQEVVRMFEKKEHHFQISEKIREKVLAREQVLSRLYDLKKRDAYCLNASVNMKKDRLTNLSLAQDKLSFANEEQRGRSSMSFSAEEKVNNHKLNFRMLHRSKNLAEEKQLLRELYVTQQKDGPSTSPLKELSEIIIQWKYNDHRYYYKLKNCEQIKPFELTRKTTESLKETMKNQVKIIGDELMEMRKKKREVETKIRKTERELHAINEKIWSFQTHLKEQHCKKEASLFVLKEMKGIGEDYWVLKCGNLEYESIHNRIISSRKSSLENAWSSLIWYG